MNPPHMPYERVPERYLAMYGDASPEELINRANVNLKEDTSGSRLARRHIKNYFAQITGVDDQFGRILSALGSEAMDEDTIDEIPQDVQGTSRASLLRHRDGPRPSSQLYLWVPYGEPALGRRGVQTHRYTLSAEKTGDGTVSYILFDNQEDPFQLENIAGENEGLVKELLETELIPWLRKTLDPWLDS